MPKEKVGNNRREKMDPPVTRTLRSRKRGCPIEMKTIDSQILGEVNDKESFLGSFGYSGGEGDQPLESSSAIPYQHINGNHGEPGVTKINQSDTKTFLVITLNDCGQRNQLPDENEMQNECDPTASSSDNTNKQEAGDKLCPSEEHIRAEDTPDLKMETNQVEGQVHQMSKDLLAEGLGKKRRRMGMCQLSEKERTQLLVKCTNKAETLREAKSDNSIDVAKVENVPSSQVMSSQETAGKKQTDEAEQNVTVNREEVNAEAAGDFETAMLCEPEIKISQENVEESVDAEDMKHRPHEEQDSQKKDQPFKAERECLMSAPDAAVTVSESGSSLCQDSDLTSGNHIPAEGELIRTVTEKHHTVPVCDAPSPKLDNDGSSQKPRPNSEQLLTLSEHEVSVSDTLPYVAGSTLELQYPESVTVSVQEEGPQGHEQTSELSNANKSNIVTNAEQVTESEMSKQDVRNTSADGDENLDRGTDLSRQMTMEKRPPLQENESKSVEENMDRARGEEPGSCHSPLTEAVAETKCNNYRGNDYTMNSSEQPEKPESFAATIGPPQNADFSDLSGRCSLDDVSDSQLNTIVMTDHEAAGDSVPQERYEDCSDLIRGLIKELSALNQTVMAAHRELENLKRRGKNSRNTLK